MARRWYHPAVLDDLDGAFRVGEKLAAGTRPIRDVSWLSAGSAYGGMSCQFVARRWNHPAVLADLDSAFRVGEILAASTGPIGTVSGLGAGGGNSEMSS